MFVVMKEKTTKGTPELNEGLNEGNPNTERTPVGNDRIDIGLIGGVVQSNTDDEAEGELPQDTQDVHKEIRSE
jgi:hypothetical protein